MKESNEMFFRLNSKKITLHDVFPIRTNNEKVCSTSSVYILFKRLGRLASKGLGGENFTTSSLPRGLHLVKDPWVLK